MGSSVSVVYRLGPKFGPSTEVLDTKDGVKRWRPYREQSNLKLVIKIKKFGNTGKITLNNLKSQQNRIFTSYLVSKNVSPFL